MPKGVRRIVTGHNDDGLAVVRIDDLLAPEKLPNSEDAFTKVWTTAQSPADLGDEADGAKRETGLSLTDGSVLRVVDHAPGSRSPMHRTQSIDYGILIEGRLDMELDSGELVHLKPGDIVVQRGTNHAWVNNYPEPARMAFILLGATPVLVGGKPLSEVGHKVAGSHL